MDPKWLPDDGREQTGERKCSEIEQDQYSTTESKFSVVRVPRARSRVSALLPPGGSGPVTDGGEVAEVSIMSAV